MPFDLDNLEKKRKELQEKIELFETQKKNVRGTIEKLTARYNIGEVSFDEYKEEYKRIFKDKTPEQWTNYYDIQIKSCKAQLDWYDSEMRKAKSALGRKTLAEREKEEKQKWISERIQKAEGYKKSVVGSVQDLVKKYNAREITYEQYHAEVKKLYGGNEPQKLVDYYDDYIKKAKVSLNVYETGARKTKVKKNLMKILPLVFIFGLVLYGLFGFVLKPEFTGLTVEIVDEVHAKTFDLTLNESANYDLDLPYEGSLNWLKLSGTVKGEGTVKVYLDDILILDSADLESDEKSTITGSVITGFVSEGEGDLSAPSEETSGGSDSGSENSGGNQVSGTENSGAVVGDQSGDGSTEESNTDGEEQPAPGVNGEEDNTSGGEDTGNGNETESESGTGESPGNETVQENPEGAGGEVEGNASVGTSGETIKQIKFEDYCKESCDLKDLGLNKTSYTLRIKVDGVEFELDKLTYEITVEKEVIEEQNVTIARPPIMIKEIPDMVIEKNQYYDLNINEYFEGAIEYYLKQTDNITTTVSGSTIRIQPNENFTGIRSSRIVVVNELGSYGSNLFNITVLDSENFTELEQQLNITGNETLNITTRQYKAIINRPVKWIKRINLENITDLENLTFEIPKESESISIKTGEEVDAAFQEAEDYENVVEEADRNEIVGGGITGNVVRDLSGRKGLFTRLWEWFGSFTITGNVIDEEELGEEITEGKESKFIDVEKIVEQTNEREIAVEYYTSAPTTTEENISSGKRIIVSGPDALNYTDVLAYSAIENKVSLNSGKIKLYWYADYEDAVNLGYINATNRTEKTKEEKIASDEKQQSKEEQNEEAITLGEEATQTNNETQENETSQEEIQNETISEETPEANQTEELDTSAEITGSFLTGFAISESDETEETKKQTTAPEKIKIEFAFQEFDLDNDGFVDYVEWIVPHLSNQTFELIIEISKAEHLDENRNFVSDIYEQVKALDGNWSEEIPDGDYVRVTFQQNLTSDRDITVYPRTVNGTPRIEVYEYNKTEVIAVFENLIDNEYNKIYLTNLTGGGECYDNETEILTEDGWKLFNGLKGEKVATLNQETKELEWETPTDKAVFDNEGEMYSIILEDGSEMRVSEKHKIYGNVRDERNNLSSVGFVVMSEENKDDFFSGFVNHKFENEIFKNVNSSFSSQVVLQGFIVCGVLDNFSNLSFKNFSENWILSASLFNVSFTGGEEGKTVTHSIELKNSSAEAYFLPGTSFSLLFNSLTCSSFSGNSSTGCQSIASQNSQSSSVISPVCLYLSDMSRFTNRIKALARNSDSNFNFALINSLMENKDSLNYINVTNFSLMPITEAYSLLQDGKEIYFLNAKNESVRVSSITKVSYSGKIYDVDVPNDVVLVRRNNDKKDEIYRIKSDKGELVVGGGQKVYVGEGLGHILKPEEETIINLPINSEGARILNNLSNDEKIESAIGGCILRNITPEEFSGGNFALFKKCLSNVNSTLFSDWANSNICLSLEPNSTLFMLNLSLDNFLTTSNGTFSSANKNNLECSVFFIFNSSGSVYQCRKNNLSVQLGEIIFKNFFDGYSCSEQFYNLPDHDSGAFEGRGSSADFIVHDNVSVDFNSHNFDNGGEVYKDFEFTEEDKDYPTPSIPNKSFGGSTLTFVCSLRPLSPENIGQSNLSANARYGESLKFNSIASGSLSMNSENGTKVICSLISNNTSFISSNVSFDFDSIFPILLSSSNVTYSGAINSSLLDTLFVSNTSKLLPLFINAEYTTLTSTTNNIYDLFDLSNLSYRSASAMFVSSVNSCTSSSVNFDFETMRSKLANLSSSSLIFLDTTNCQLILFINASSFNSSGMRIVTSAMENKDDMNYINVTNFSLMLIADAYSSLQEGKELYVLDSEGNSVKVNSIEKEYVDSKEEPTPFWSGNSNTNGTYSQDVFDLRVVNGSVEFEHIVDPAGSMIITLNSPTNYSTGNSLSPLLNVTVNNSLGNVMNVTFWNKLVSISPGGSTFSCGIISNGSAMCWGGNTNGQLGDGTATQRTSPVFINSSNTFVSISSDGISNTHMCGIISNGSAMCWGLGTSGQLGNGLGTSSNNSVFVNTTNSFVAISAGTSHTCGIILNGSAMCWGLGTGGALGYGGTSNQNNPVYVNATNSFVAISAGGTHSCGILSNGSAMCWGTGNNGKLGYGGTSTQNNPVFVNTTNSFVAISIGSTHTCGIISNGSVMCWGENTNGQLGNGSSGIGQQSPLPVFVNTTNSFVAINLGSADTCGIISNGSAMCWGIGNNGRLGDGTTTQRVNPIYVNTTNSFVAISAGNAHTCGIISNGSAMCWGFGTGGQLGYGGTSSQNNPVYVNTTSFSGKYFPNETINIGNNTNVASGGSTNVTWNSLRASSTYLWSATADDGFGIFNSQIWSFTTGNGDTTAPVVNITYPINGTTYYINVSAINYTIVETNPDKCWYSNSSGTWNSSTVAAGTNFTSVTSIEGSNTWIVYCNDTTGNANSSTITFTKDTSDRTPPDIDFTAPTLSNDSSQSSTATYVNISSSDTGGDHYTFADFDRDVVLWLRMDDKNSSGDPTDLSSYSNNGTRVNAIINSTNGKFGNGTYFDGNGDYLYLPHTSSLEPLNELTYAAWIYPKAFSANNVIMQKDDGNLNPYFVKRFYLASGSLRFNLYNGTSITYISGATLQTNTWQHVAVSIDEDSYVKIYVNGTLLYANTTAIGDLLRGDTRPFSIGAALSSGSPTSYFNGSIDEVMVFNRSLSAQEIKALYNASANQYYNNFTGLAEGAHTFTGYAGDKAGNKNQTEQRTVTVDTVIPGVNFTNPTPSSGTTQSGNSIYVNVSSTDANGRYTFVDFDHDVLLHYTMDNINSSGDPTDLSFYSRNGSKVGTASQTGSGYFGKGFSVDGPSSSYVSAPTISNLNLTINGFTQSMWVKLDSPPSTGQTDYLSYIYAGTADSFYFRTAESVGAYSLSAYGEMNNDAFTITKSGMTLSELTGGWHHLVSVYNKTDVIFYVDGANIGSDGTSNVQTDLNFEMNFFGYDMVGKIDDVLLFNRSLSSQEILALYNATANQYSNNFTSLGDGTHTFTGYAVDKAGNKNQTETRNVTVNSPKQVGLSVLYPTGNVNVTQNLFFNVTLNISCLLGSCGTVNVSLDPTTISWCYQESANVSTSCGGLNTGVYSTSGPWTNPTNAYDGNWGTSAEGTDASPNYFYVNYSKPVNALSTSLWQIKDASITANLTINSNCWSQSILQFRVDVDFANYPEIPGWSCYNGTGWVELRRVLTYAPLVSEEAMIWNISTTTTKGLINTTIGATPFYTNSTNPLTTSSLSAGQSQLITFWVNATGSVGTNSTFFAFANLTSDLSVSNITSEWNVSIIAGNVAPTIPFVSSIANTNPIENSMAPITFVATVDDANGASDIDVTRTKANFTRSGEALRQNTSCAAISGQDTATSKNFSCTISMWYFDGAGAWNISVLGTDKTLLTATNTSTTFNYNSLSAMVLSPNNLDFGAANSTQIWKTGPSTLVNNTGNYNATNISISGYNLFGQTDYSYTFGVGNFTVGISGTGGAPPPACNAPMSATRLVNDTYVNITGSSLPRGNHSVNDGSTGQEILYYCIPSVPSLPTQEYNTYNPGTSQTNSWIIKIALAVFVRKLGRKKKTRRDVLAELKRKLQKPGFDIDKLALLDEKLKEEQGVTLSELLSDVRREKETLQIPIDVFRQEIGPSESLCKYLKENVGFSYSEIADVLNRDDRTVWINCRNAATKKAVKIRIQSDTVYVPVSIFKDRRLSVLEAVVGYFRDRGVANVEIARLLGKDPRNIWTLYSRAVKKLRN